MTQNPLFPIFSKEKKKHFGGVVGSHWGGGGGYWKKRPPYLLQCTRIPELLLQAPAELQQQQQRCNGVAEELQRRWR